MSKVGISAYVVTTYQGNKIPDKAKLCYNQTFIASTGETVIAGDLESNQFFREVPVTINDGQITIGAFEGDNQIDSTTDGLDLKNTTCSLALFAGKTLLAIIFNDLKIYPTPSTQVWSDIVVRNRARFLPLRPSYLDSEQSVNLFVLRTEFSIDLIAAALIANEDFINTLATNENFINTLIANEDFINAIALQLFELGLVETPQDFQMVANGGGEVEASSEQSQAFLGVDHYEFTFVIPD